MVSIALVLPMADPNCAELTHLLNAPEQAHPRHRSPKAGQFAGLGSFCLQKILLFLYMRTNFSQLHCSTMLPAMQALCDKYGFEPQGNRPPRLYQHPSLPLHPSAQRLTQLYNEVAVANSWSPDQDLAGQLIVQLPSWPEAEHSRRLDIETPSGLASAGTITSNIPGVRLTCLGFGQYQSFVWDSSQQLWQQIYPAKGYWGFYHALLVGLTAPQRQILLGDNTLPRSVTPEQVQRLRLLFQHYLVTHRSEVFKILYPRGAP